MINSNWHPILYRFKVIADCCFNFGHFAYGGFVEKINFESGLEEKAVMNGDSGESR